VKLRFNRESDRVVALDIGSRMVKVVELGRGSKGPALFNYGASHVSPDAVVEGEVMDRDLLLEAIGSAFSQAGIKPDKVVSAISSRQVIVKRLFLEQMEEAEVRARIETEASSHIPFEIEDVSLDFQILDPAASDGKMEVLLVAAKREVIYEHISLLKDAQVNAQVIDVDAFAIQNLFEALGASQPLATLVNIGAGLTNVNIVRNGLPLFTRDFSVGCGSYLESLQRDMQIGFEDALHLITGELDSSRDEVGREAVVKMADDIAVGLERSLAYLRSAGEVESLGNVYLSGGGGNLPALRKSLKERLGVPIQAINPLEVLEVDDAVRTRLEDDGAAPLLGVAIGLGIREVAL